MSDSLPMLRMTGDVLLAFRKLSKVIGIAALLCLVDFHAAYCDRLLSTTVRHARLVSEEEAISLSEKRNLPFTFKSGGIVGDFSKLKHKLEKLSSHSAGRSFTHGKRKREKSYSVEKKKQAIKESKNFIPKVAASGPSQL
ncbi:hypothetical protein L3X38_004189 [Prunus dulcis]|uniref:Uncharacterized protein n=1 Tax=Prunus dulcis TaxID=3755 RepID=A0AAD4ZNH1_PRUDU|nr:hypothetical protein L3X38_004189 [Prunus dulcis]